MYQISSDFLCNYIYKQWHVIWSQIFFLLRKMLYELTGIWCSGLQSLWPPLFGCLSYKLSDIFTSIFTTFSTLQIVFIFIVISWCEVFTHKQCLCSCFNWISKIFSNWYWVQSGPISYITNARISHHCKGKLKYSHILCVLFHSLLKNI